MAGRVDILLKLVGDAKDAVKGFNDTTRAAQKTEAQVDKTQQSIQRMLQGISVSSAISAFGNLQSAIGQFIDILDPGQAEREARLVRGLGLAGDPATMGTAAAALARERGLNGASVSRTKKFLQDVWPGTPRGQTKLGRSVNELRNILEGMSPEEAAVTLGNIPPEFFANAPEGYTRADLQRELVQRQRATAYRASLSGPSTSTGTGGNLTVNNLYPTGVNPRAVDTNMSRYERVNGRPRRP